MLELSEGSRGRFTDRNESIFRTAWALVISTLLLGCPYSLQVSSRTKTSLNNVPFPCF